MRRFWLITLLALATACNTAELVDDGGDGSGGGDGPACYSAYEDCDPRQPADPNGDAPKSSAAPAPPPSTGVTIQVQPSDQGKAILAAIQGAQTSVHMTIYLLTDTKVMDALGDLKDAGKEVKVVLNKTFPPDGGDNQPAYDKLTSRGVAVQWASPVFAFTHAKTIVIDGSKVIIMTMNLTYTSPTTNREYIATDLDPGDVADAEKIFAADFAQQPITLTTKLVVSPQKANSISPRDQLVDLIDSAEQSLDIEIQSLSDSALVDAIIAANTRQVPVRLLVDGDTSTSSSQKAAITKMKSAGIAVKSLQTPDLHAKVIVVDGQRTFVGSQNFTATALDDNREVGVIVASGSEAQKVRDVISADLKIAVDL